MSLEGDKAVSPEKRSVWFGSSAARETDGVGVLGSLFSGQSEWKRRLRRQLY